jgi:signal transduction histidine kinase
MGIVSLVRINFDLLSVGIAIAGILLLGSIIFFNNTKSITNRTFLYFAIVTALWGISNYLEYRFDTILATLWALRIQIFISTLHALFFFQLAYVFPREEVRFPFWYKFLLIPVVASTMILALTPLVFSGITTLAPPGYVTNPERGPGIVLFSIVAFGLLIGGVIVIAVKAWKSMDMQERKQEYVIAIGMTLTAILILLFNVFFPIFLNQLSFIPLAALFLLPFIGLISYSIYRYHLFNLEVATTAFLGFMVTIFTFVNILYSTQPSEFAINITAFVIVLVGSIKIVRDTLNLEKVTDNLQKVAAELMSTNERQENLIHFIGHEVKGFLTKAAGSFAALSEGDFGPLSPEAKPFVERALAGVRQDVEATASILQASNLKKGTVTYTKVPFDFKALVIEAVAKAKPTAEQKGLRISSEIDDGSYIVTGDKMELGDHVLHNLIDNAINYTPTGSITISLSREGGKLRFAVQDTGVGITEEDKKRLFTEGGHGIDSIRVNVHSTGYGLYIAKQIIDAHNGSIRAESEGTGKGSMFVVELPVS